MFAGEGDRYTLKFNDAKVCKSFLLECCPHEILASTVSKASNCILNHLDFNVCVKSKFDSP